MGGCVKGEFYVSGNNLSFIWFLIVKKNIFINKCDVVNREYLLKIIYIDVRLIVWVIKLLSYFLCFLFLNKVK